MFHSAKREAFTARIVRNVFADFTFRAATPDDAAELADLFETFFSEARYRDRGIVYSHERALAWLKGVIASGACPHVVAARLDTHEIVGATSFTMDSTFCVDPVAVLHTIYVLKAYRRTAIGRVLAALMVDLALAEGAVAFHAPLASGMGESGSLQNLFQHAGFEQIGVIMGRRL